MKADLSPLQQSGDPVIADSVGAAGVARVLQIRDGAGPPVASSWRGCMEEEGLPGWVTMLWMRQLAFGALLC